MFLKLLKYDIMATAKTYLLMSIAILGLCIAAFFGGLLQNEILFGFISSVSLFTSIMYIGAYFVISVLYFYNKMSGRERYLTHTLPVKDNSIILSKYLATVFWGIFVMGILCLYWFVAAEYLLFRPFSYHVSDFISTNDELLNFNYLYILIFVQLFVFLIPMTGFFICVINMPRFKNNGIAVAITGWIVTGQVISVIQAIISGLMIWNAGIMENMLNNDLSPAQVVELVQIACNVTMISSILLGALFYAGAVRITAKHKNI